MKEENIFDPKGRLDRRAAMEVHESGPDYDSQRASVEQHKQRKKQEKLLKKQQRRKAS